MDIVRPFAIGLVLAVAAAPSFAQQQQRVYQWKDANGVTHYTDLPPSQAHQEREIRTRQGTAAPAAAKPAENPQCLDSRTNLQRLQAGEVLGIDIDGDGKADRNLSAEERASQIELNQAAIKAYCKP